MPNLQVVQNLNPTAQYVRDGTNNSPLSLTNFATGKVGIGTNQPQTTLHVLGGNVRFERNFDGEINLSIRNTNAAAGGGGMIALEFDSNENNSRITQKNKLLEIGFNDNLQLRKRGEPTPALFIDPLSKVGIGTNSPTKKLDVKGDTIIRGDNWSAGEDAILYLGDTNHYIKSIYGDGVRIGTYGAQDVIVIKEGWGNVGIGTANPTALLEIDKILTVPPGETEVVGFKNKITINASGSFNQLVALSITPSLNDGGYQDVTKCCLQITPINARDPYKGIDLTLTGANLSNMSTGIFVHVDKGANGIVSGAYGTGVGVIGTGYIGGSFSGTNCALKTTQGNVLIDGGKVGIGTTEPTAKLDVDPGTISGANPNIRLRGVTSTVPTGGNAGDVVIYESGSTRRLYIKIGSTWRYVNLT